MIYTLNPITARLTPYVGNEPLGTVVKSRNVPHAISQKKPMLSSEPVRVHCGSDSAFRRNRRIKQEWFGLKPRGEANQ